MADVLDEPFDVELELEPVDALDDVLADEPDSDLASVDVDVDLDSDLDDLPLRLSVL